MAKKKIKRQTSKRKKIKRQSMKKRKKMTLKKLKDFGGHLYKQMIFPINTARVLAVFFLLIYFCVSAPVFLLCEEDNRFDELIEEYEQKIAYDPYDDNAKEKLSVFYHNRANELADEGRWPEAIDYEERAHVIVPDVIG